MILESAHATAAESTGYDTARTWCAIICKFKEAFNGNTPYDWQLDMAEALILGLDSMVIAGTGSGKTMPFGMPLLVDETKKKIVLIISPLNDLEVEQVDNLSYQFYLYLQFHCWQRLNDSKKWALLRLQLMETHTPRNYKRYLNFLFGGFSA
jgi:hypothetical protein